VTNDVPATSPRRHTPTRYPLLRLLALLPLACVNETTHFTPAADDGAFALIENRWSAADGDGVSLTLCEDFAAEPAPPYEEPDYNTCQIAHVIRGHGRGYAHDVNTGGVGCGGCPFQVAGYVQGTLEGGTLPGPLFVRGIVSMGASGGQDPYEPPFNVDLACEGGEVICSVSAEIRGDGMLALQVWLEADAASGVPTLTTTLPLDSAASCPAP
jgi:hypothetical protein